MKRFVPLPLLVACDMPKVRQCERAGGIVMRHRDEPVCVAREGLRILPIQPEYGR
jgi:hypothetical protein